MTSNIEQAILAKLEQMERAYAHQNPSPRTLSMFEELREEISGIKDSLKSIEENYQIINDILNGSRFAASIFKGVVAFVLGVGALVVGLSKFRQWF